MTTAQLVALGAFAALVLAGFALIYALAAGEVAAEDMMRRDGLHPESEPEGERLASYAEAGAHMEDRAA